MPKGLNVEVKVKLDRERTLRIDFNTFMVMEDVLGESVLGGFGDGMSARQLRALTYAAFVHEDPTLTVEKAGQLLSDYFWELPDIIGKAMKEAQDDKEGAPDRPTPVEPSPGSTSGPTDAST